MTARSTACSFAQFATHSASLSACRLDCSERRWRPGLLLLATVRSWTRPLAVIASPRACSRAPPPTNRTRIPYSPASDPIIESQPSPQLHFHQLRPFPHRRPLPHLSNPEPPIQPPGRFVRLSDPQ